MGTALASAPELRSLGERWPLAIGGPVAQRAGKLGPNALELPGDPVTEAVHVTAVVEPEAMR